MSGAGEAPARGVWPALLGCFVLSGFAGLVYETAWTRELSFVFGTSELAVATVLAAYMGGLALGSAVAGRTVHRLRRPVAAYGVLELGIALAALAVPWAIRGMRGLYVLTFGGRPELPDAGGLTTATFYLISTFAILLVPTALMGATLPVLTRHAVRAEDQIGPRVGMLYAANTLGAVAGVVAAGFVLLPALGLRLTIWAAISVNAAVFVLAAWLARRAAPVDAGAAPPPDRPAATPARRGHWVLPAIALSGAVSFTYEVLWTRLLGHLLGGSIYAFATMLASFLAGIALGAALASRLATGARRATVGFAWAQVGAAGLSLLAFLALDRLPGMAQALRAGAAPTPLADAALAAAVLLPGAVCIGATYPMAVRILARGSAEAAPVSARLYAWNTVGAIVGSVGAGFVVIPVLGFERTVAVAAAVNLGLATLALSRAAARRRLATGLAAAAALGLLLAPLPPPWSLLRASPLSLRPQPGEVIYYEVGRSASVLLLEVPGERQLRTNGLQESAILPPLGRPTRFVTARWLSALPALARPEARSLLVVGLGGGVALESLPPGYEHVDVVELEPEVVEANRVTASWRRRDPLSDPRVRVVENDARSALLLAGRRYDAIASQPSHPWTAGASHLYTREFFELVHEHLEPGGVFVQWMGERFVDPPLVRSLLATLGETFRHVRLYAPVRGALLFAASDAPLAVEEHAAEALARGPGPFEDAAILAPEDVAAALVLDEAGAARAAAGAPLITDDRNWLQIRSPGIARAGGPGVRVAAALGGEDPLTERLGALDPVRLVRRLVGRRAIPRARRVAEALSDGDTRLLARAWVDLSVGRREDARRALLDVLRRDPRREDARAAWLLLERAALSGDAPGEGRLDGPPLGALLPAEAAVARGWALERRGGWEELRALDDALGSLAPNHGLFPAAARLRATWRVQAPSGDAAARAREALPLLDRALLFEPRPRLHLLRARAAWRAGDAGVALADLARARATAPRRGLAPAARREMAALLAELATDPRWGPDARALANTLSGP